LEYDGVNGAYMISKKLLITAIAISVIGHMAVIALSSILEIGGNPNMDRAFTVHFEEQAEISDNAEKAHFKVSPGKPYNNPENKMEDTVELGNKNTKYYSYLKQLKKKVDRRWSYPTESYARKEKGISVIKFSITEEGTLVDSCLVASSGYDSLDREALRVIQSTGPLAPLPKSFNLSKLHIIAKFQYRLAD